jgi:hypothetical protein
MLIGSQDAGCRMQDAGCRLFHVYALWSKLGMFRPRKPQLCSGVEAQVDAILILVMSCEYPKGNIKSILCFVTYDNL